MLLQPISFLTLSTLEHRCDDVFRVLTPCVSRSPDGSCLHEIHVFPCSEYLLRPEAH